jgi:5-methylcytosine-specific restriction endonuclease McrA
MRGRCGCRSAWALILGADLKTIMPLQQTGRHHHLYNTRRWQRRAKAQLKEHPLCVMCLARNMVTPATVADHITPHHGDHQLFYFGELQSLCQH